MAPDYLYKLDFSESPDGVWSCLYHVGNGPGKRYGHSMAYLKPYIIVFGGNTANKITNDVWVINIEEHVLEWQLLKFQSKVPGPRMYHASGVCKYGGASGMIIFYGGRSDTHQPLSDTWGLRRHRNGDWSWVVAPYSNNYAPIKRFQHTLVFYHNFMFIIGGRSNDELKQIPIEVYDTELSEWFGLINYNKFRHVSWISNNLIHVHGGFDYKSPMMSESNLVTIELQKLINTNEALVKRYEKLQENIKKIKTKNLSTPTLSPNTSIISSDGLGYSSGVVGNTLQQQLMLNNKMLGNVNNNVNSNANFTNNANNSNSINIPMTNIKENHLNNLNNLNNINAKNTKLNNNTKNLTNNNQFISSGSGISPIIFKEGEISILPSKRNDDRVIIKKVTLGENGKLVYLNNPTDFPLADQFIHYLLNPGYFMRRSENDVGRFPFTIEQISQLTKQAINIVKYQPMLLKINAPVKVFGDVHGQYADLMTFFYKWGEPKDGPNGDIAVIDYLFLGDYVDRGYMSLETICLLMSLKVKYPESIHLLRGNHEDRLINAYFGFLDECQYKLGEDSASDDSIFNLINEFFEYLPLAAVIENQILCLHGGIGANVHKLSDIESVNRPLEVVHEARTMEQKIVMDVLWSDPTDNDEELGIQPNSQRDSNNYGNIVKYGPDVVKSFLAANNLTYVIRAHECVLDGFERFASGSLITLFSATDYCGRHNNAGAMLIIKNNFEMVPHLIYPPEGGNHNWIEDEEFLKKRPPTPPRVRYNKGNY